jgi:hypothetical protein
MLLRTAGAFTALLIGLAGSAGPATAQFFPPPGPRYVPMRPLPPPVAIEDETPAYDPPPGYREPPPGYRQPVPGGGGQYGSQQPYGAQPQYGQQQPQYGAPPPYEAQPRYGAQPPYGSQGGYGSQGAYGGGQQQPRGNEPTYVRPLPQYGDAYPQQEPDRYPPPGGGYQGSVPGYEPIDPRDPRQPVDPRQQPNYGAAPSSPLDILRPPGAIGSVGPNDPAVDERGSTGSTGPVYSALPPEDRPEVGPKKELPAQFRRTQVDYRTKEPAGTLVIDTANT